MQYKKLQSFLAVAICHAAIALALLASPVAAQAQSADAGKRVALLVGVNKYLKPGLNDLSYPEADVTAVAAELAKQNFETHVLLGSAAGDKQATRANILGEARKMVSNLGKQDLALVMLSGHGQQMTIRRADGSEKDDGFYVPLEGNSSDPQSLVSLSELIDDILAPNVGRRLMLVDACRNTPRDPSRGSKGIQGKLITLPENTAVLFSCCAGQQSFESDELKHGLFTHCLLEGLRGEAARSGNVAWDSLVAYVTDQMASDEIKKYLPEGRLQVPIPAGGVERVVLAKVSIPRRTEPAPASVPVNSPVVPPAIKPPSESPLTPYESIVIKSNDAIGLRAQTGRVGEFFATAKGAGDRVRPPIALDRYRVLLIGVDEYVEFKEVPELASFGSCKAEVESLRNQFISAGVPRDRVTLLHDGLADKRYHPNLNNVYNHLTAAIRETHRGEFLLVVFSGLTRSVRDQDSLCLPDLNEKQGNIEAIAIEPLLKKFAECQADAKWLLVDVTRTEALIKTMFTPNR